MSELEDAGGELALAVETFLSRGRTRTLRAALNAYWRAVDGEHGGCDACRGSGEGAASGTTCGDCRGRGVS